MSDLNMDGARKSSRPKLEDVEARADPDEDPEQKRWRDMERNLITRIAQGTAGASIILNLVSMIVESSGIVFVAGIIALFIGSIVIYFQFMIQDEDSLRMVQNDLRHKVNDFAEENVELVASNNDLAGKVDNLKAIEGKLEKVAEKNGTSATKFRDLLVENQKTLDAMEANTKAEVMASMMEHVFDADEKDLEGQYGHIDDQELDALVFRLKLTSTYELNEENFRRRLDKTRSVSDVVLALQTIYDDDIPPEEKIITIKKKSLPF